MSVEKISRDTDMDRLDKQFAFIKEIDKEKQITRQTPLADGSRKENDAEHAWHMAIMTMLLGEYANEEIDRYRTMSMLLIHDLIEIYSGDTYCYDEAGKESQRERELQAADRLFGMLPEDQALYMRSLWDEFEEGDTPEARFARTMDRIQPTMLNRSSGGISWLEHDIAISQVLKRNAISADGSEVLWNYAKEKFLKPAVEDGQLKGDVPI